VTTGKFIYCPRCGKSDAIYQTDYEEENADGEYEVDDDGRKCDRCNWEGDVSELVCKDDEP
jgi:hypothetical protein